MANEPIAMPRPGCDCAMRFTLIEMLVVVAIIAILASLLAPSLQKALNAAKGLNCLNNLRQNAMTLTGYATDHNDFVLVRINANANGTYNGKSGFEGPFYYCVYGPSYGYGANKKPETHNPEWLCPSRLSIPDNSQWGNESTPVRFTKRVYATLFPPTSTGYCCYRLRAIHQPSYYPFLLDTLCPDGRMLAIISNLSTFNGYIGMMHNLRANIAFFDGHAQSMGIDGIEHAINTAFRTSTASGTARFKEVGPGVNFPASYSTPILLNNTKQ